MDDMPHLSDDELDKLLIAHVGSHSQKVAALISVTMLTAEKTIGHELDEDRLGQRVEWLVKNGTLENAGDVREWRYSEVRVPADMNSGRPKQ